MSTLTTIQLFFCPTTKKQHLADLQLEILSDQDSGMVRKSVDARIYNLLGAIQEKYPEEKTLMMHGKALMNVTTDYRYTSIHHYILREKRRVLHTNAAHPILPGMSPDQVKEAWMQHLKQSGSAGNPTISNMKKTVDFMKLMAWVKCPDLDDAEKKRHLLVMTVSGEVAASIRSGNCKDNIQAEEVDKFMKSIRPHWISSSANNIVGPSGDIVLSSMTLHQACRQVKAPNSELNLTHVEISGAALAQPLTDPASTPIMCNTIQNDNVAAQPSVQTKENDSKAAPDEPNETGTAGDSKTNKSGSNTNKTTPKDKSDSDKKNKAKTSNARHFDWKD